MQSVNKPKKILILGGGFAGISVLRELESSFKNNDSIEITLINEDNFFLFTPMLPELASGMIRPSAISIPLRMVCKKTEFIQAKVSSIDLKNKLVAITRPFDGMVKVLSYDYLVIAMGSTTNFFGNKNIEKHAFTIKTIQDAIGIKTHLIHMLEIADTEKNSTLQEKLLTVVVVGAGFAGVETIGEINSFVRDSVKSYYHNINPDNIKMILISASDKILPELGEELGKKAYESLQKAGIRIVPNTKAVDAGDDFVFLGNGETISCNTLIWTAGVTIDSVIRNLECEHKSGKIVVNDYLRLSHDNSVYSLGDCAAITDSKTGNLYPPTAQHALRQSRIVSHNLKATILGRTNLKKFNYESKGMMAIIGKHDGIAKISGYSLSGLPAWFVWKTYYLMMLPTFEKKLKVALDWTVNSLFTRDITLVRKIKRKSMNKFVTDGIDSLDQVLFSADASLKASQ
ncbi:MAG: NAD(P)/FAD-dependent oxidoreductase [Candidatus Nitrosotenuis sp.]